MKNYERRLRKLEARVRPRKLVVKFQKAPGPGEPEIDLPLEEEEDEDTEVMYVCFRRDEETRPAPSPQADQRASQDDRR